MSGIKTASKFSLKDFDNPVILTYVAQIKYDEEFNVDCKQEDKEVRANLLKLKLIYSWIAVTSL